MIYYNEHFVANNIDEAFLFWYNRFTDNKESKQSRDGSVVGECINAVTVIKDPTRCIMLNDVRKMPFRYAVGEFLWYLSGNSSVKEIGKYSKVWEKLSDDGFTANSNYGYCVKYKFGFNQYDYVKKLLMKDSATRQAVIHIKEANNKESKDVNCTVCLQFFIRENKLYLTTYMRSNDLWLGFPYDVFQFTNLQVLLSMELGLELGTYTHIAGSLHLYERNAKT